MVMGIDCGLWHWSWFAYLIVMIGSVFDGISFDALTETL
jgi:hypothetical protein